MKDKDWVVEENGVERRVDRVETLDEPWELTVWIDGPLCLQGALPRTLLGLAHRAPALVELGSVRIVVAGDAADTVLAPTRDAGKVVDTLARLSAQELCSGEPDALFWEARGLPKGAQGKVYPATVEKATKALTELRTLVERRSALIASSLPRCEAAACALLLVSHGYALDADLRLPQEVRPPDSAEVGLALSRETDLLGKRLALARWEVVALPFAPPPPADEESEAERPLPPEVRPGPAPFPQVGSGDHGPPSSPIGMHPAGRARIGPPPQAADVYLLPELGPLRRLAAASGGAVLRVPEQLAGLLESLAERRRVWYHTTPFTPGEPRTLVVRVKDIRTEAPAWVGVP